MLSPEPSAKPAPHSTSKIRYARLLLQLFHSDASKDATIDNFIAEYSKGLQTPAEYRSKLEEQLLIGEYNHLKNTLETLKLDYSNNLQKLNQTNTNRYKSIKDKIAQKQHACLENLQIRLQSIKPAGDDEELVRVKKLIENGLWGCLGRLHDRIAKLRRLEEGGQ